jgi:oleate hydratase
MGFTMHDRMELVQLAEASEEKLGNSRITDWLSPPFFQTNFWHMWQQPSRFSPGTAPSSSSAIFIVS